jgi:hypothetical protein
LCDDLFVILPPSVPTSGAVVQYRSGKDEGREGFVANRKDRCPRYHLRFALNRSATLKMESGMEEVVGSIPTKVYDVALNQYQGRESN